MRENYVNDSPIKAFGGDRMKVKLWQVKFQSKKYEGERPQVTINAPNIKCATDKALKKMKGQEGCTLSEIKELLKKK